MTGRTRPSALPILRNEEGKCARRARAVGEQFFELLDTILMLRRQQETGVAMVVRHQCYWMLKRHDGTMYRVFTFVLRQLVKRGEVCERDDPTRVKPLRKAREISAFGHRCHE